MRLKSNFYLITNYEYFQVIVVLNVTNIAIWYNNVLEFKLTITDLYRINSLISFYYS